MTDEELAEKLKRLAPAVSPRGPLLEEAADRIYALAAHNALLKASLAQAEREAEKPAPQPDRVAELGAELLNAVDTICSQSGEDTEKFARWMCDESGLLQMVMAHFGAADKDKKIASLEAEVERLRKDAERYQQVRRGQKWSVIDGIGATLRGERLDDAIDAAMAAEKEAQS